MLYAYMNDDIFYISELYSLYKFQSPKLAHYCFNWRSGFFIIKKGEVITMRTIVIANNKGGVAKTTTSLCLAAGLREKKKKVLLIDLDMQQNLALTCGVDVVEDLDGSSLYDVFHGKADINNCLFQIFDNIADLDILVGGINLIYADEDRKINEDSLNKALMNLDKQYDFIVIDTPPSITTSTKMAIKAADDLIIPIRPDVYSLWGIGSLDGFIQDVNPDINKAGLLLVGLDERTRLSKVLLESAKSAADGIGTKLFKAMIHNGVAIPESQLNKTTLFKYAPNSRVANDYMAFVNEYLKGAKKHG